MKAKFETETQTHNNTLKAKDIVKQAELEELKNHLEMKYKYYTPNVLNEMVLGSISEIYEAKQYNKKDNVKVTTIGDGTQSGNTTDVAGQIISQMMNTYNTLEEQMNSQSKDVKKIVAAATKK